MKTNRYIFFKLNFRISCHLINLDVVEDRLMKFCRNLYIGLDFFQMTNLFELLIFSLNFDLMKERHSNRKNLFTTFRNFNVLLLKPFRLITPIKFELDTTFRISFISDRFNLEPELLSLHFLICKLIFTTEKAW